MATDYFHDYQAYMASGALVSPAHTPEHSPPPKSHMSSRSRKPRDFSAMSAPLPSFDTPDSQPGNNGYGFDSGRFTPTLHASLVSEILTLRRELESKHKFIDGLEDTLKTAQSENESLSDQLRETNKKSKQTEQKFRYLENGTFDAVEGLLSERDSVKSLNQELHIKLEALGKRVRKQDEDAARSNEIWAKESQTWNTEKRLLEQKVHITESRLKNLVEEMKALQAASQDQPERGVTFKDDDVSSIRSYSTLRHTRNQSSLSTKSLARSIGSIKRPGMSSLANELNSDEEDYDTEDYDQEEDDIPFSDGPRLSIDSRSSGLSDCKAKRILGLVEAPSDTEGRDAMPITPTESARPSPMAGITARLGFMAKVMGSSKNSSRSASPASTIRQKDDPIDIPANDSALNLHQATGRAASEQSVGQPMATEQPQAKSPNLLPSRRVMEAPISPPETPICAFSGEGPIEPRETPPYQSASTQTDLLAPQPPHGDLALRRNASVSKLDVHPIPSIAIHPPLSTPTSPRGTLLPLGMASKYVQTDLPTSKPMKDVAVQTETRSDQKPAKVPNHLMPSALESEVGNETLKAADQKSQTIPTHRAPFHRSTFSKDGCRVPLKAINLPPPTLLALSREAEQQQLDVKRYNNSSDTAARQWQADFDANDLPGDSSDVDLKDVFGNMPGLARPSVRSMFQGPPKTVPEDRAISPANIMIYPEKWSSPTERSRKGSDSSSVSTRPSSSRGKGSSIRNARTGTFFGSHEHSRPSSTSSHSTRTQPPPYPIPSRSSSRPASHVGSDEPSSPSPFDTYSLRSRRSSRESHLPPNIPPRSGLRKVQSSGAMKSKGYVSPRRRRRAPNLEPIQSVAFDAPSIDRFLLPGVTTPAQEQHEQSMDFDSPEVDRESAAEEEEPENNDNVIVDAIAATMVGEWMWKYVRRRRSFGIGERSDQGGADEGAGTSGVRHKRWVWLSPYEHTVMWSAKQPTSGPALLGKNGRKLTIKSVLDVKDATPLHKSAAQEPIFDRSILILTPERALKITATSKERHYLWLTALSFLAQSGRGPPQVPRVSQIPEGEPGKGQQRQSSLIQTPMQHGRKPAGPMSNQTEAARSSDIADAELDSATPPNISRLAAAHRHQRKRSSTNPQISTSNNGLSPNETSTTTSSASARRSSNTPALRPSLTSSSRSSRRNSAASPDKSNLSEAKGTVCMSAFVGQSRQGSAQTVGVPQPARPNGADKHMGHSSFAPSISTTDENDKDPFEEF